MKEDHFEPGLVSHKIFAIFEFTPQLRIELTIFLSNKTELIIDREEIALKELSGNKYNKVRRGPASDYIIQDFIQSEEYKKFVEPYKYVL